MNIIYGMINIYMTDRCVSANMQKLVVTHSRTVGLQKQIFLSQRLAFFDYTLFEDVELREEAEDTFIICQPRLRRKDLTLCEISLVGRNIIVIEMILQE